jgi:hypothetical protein
LLLVRTPHLAVFSGEAPGSAYFEKAQSSCCGGRQDMLYLAKSDDWCTSDRADGLIGADRCLFGCVGKYAQIGR